MSGVKKRRAVRAARRALASKIKKANEELGRKRTADFSKARAEQAQRKFATKAGIMRHKKKVADMIRRDRNK